MTGKKGVGIFIRHTIFALMFSVVPGMIYAALKGNALLKRFTILPGVLEMTINGFLGLLWGGPNDAFENGGI